MGMSFVDMLKTSSEDEEDSVNVINVSPKNKGKSFVDSFSNEEPNIIKQINIQKQLKIEPEELEPEEEKSTIGSIVGDITESVTSGEILRAIPAGVERAINETANFATSSGAFLENKLNVGRLVWGDGEGFRYLDREEVQQAIADGKMSVADSLTESVSEVDIISDDFNTVTGNMSSGITQFATGFIFTRGIASAKNASTVNKVANTMIRSAIADAVVFDPQEANVSKMLEDNGWAVPIVSKYLATDQDDSEFANRLRNAAEGALLGSIIEIMIRGVKGVKLGRIGKTEIEADGEVSKPTKAAIVKNDIDLKDAIDSNKKVTPEQINDANKKATAKSKKLDYKKAEANTLEEQAKQKAAAKQARDGNRDIELALIKDFERSTGRDISTKNNKGDVTGIDRDKIRSYKETILKDTVEFDSYKKAQRTGIIPEGSSLDEFDLDEMLTQEDLITPMLKEEYLDKIVAVASDLNKINPELFKDGKIIDRLFDATVDKSLIPDEQLLGVLSKYGMSFEDFVLVTVGQGSEYGRGLQKFSQIANRRPKDLKSYQQSQAILENQGKIKSGFLRFENLRRGLMVSSLATASRNLTSAGIRMPLEGLGNVMDTALLRATEGGFTFSKAKKGATELVSPSNWANSFNHMRYVFRNPVAIKQYEKLLFSQEGMKAFDDKLFGQINEIRRKTGRVDPKTENITKTEKVFQAAESTVDFANVFNRFQEFTVRRGVFFGELERLTKQNWNVDLFDELNKGNINKLINDSPQFRADGKKSFAEIMNDATRKALDVTYAKQPEVEALRDLTTWITKNGLTVIVPFPRFMFNAMELMGQYAGGASIPLTRKLRESMMRGVKDPALKGLTAKERELIGRNVVGFATAIAAYQWRTSSDAPADYKKIPTGSDTEMDTTPQFPMRQYLWIGEAIKRYNDGTLSDWLDGKEASETFLGTNIRTGVGHSIIEEVGEIISGGTDLVGQEAWGRSVGRAIGNYLSSWAVPLGQIVDTQRALGFRSMEYRDMAEDPTLDGIETFKTEVTRPIRSRGTTSVFTPSSESDRPIKEYMFQEGEAKERGPALSRLLFGLNITESDSEEGEYIKNLGFSEYKLSSRSKIPSIRNLENKTVRLVLPTIVQGAQMIESMWKDDYKSRSSEYKNEYTELQHVNLHIREHIEDEIKAVRSDISSDDSKFADTDNPQLLKAHYDFRKLSKTKQKSAQQFFFREYNRAPNVTNLEDAAMLVELGNI